MILENLQLILSADDRYTQHLGVTLASLFANHSANKYRLIINILDGGISDINKKKLAIVKGDYPAEIIYWPVKPELFKNCPEIGHLKLPTYYRLLIPEIIGSEVKKVIYLDSDLVVNGDISELYEQNLAKQIIGAVPEISAQEVLAAWETENLKTYFNAGVLLIDLEKWRELKISEQAFDFIAKNAARLKWADQDALNLVLRDHWLALEKKFNLQIDRNQKKVANLEPLIIHYVGRLKPWEFLYNNYYSRYYWRYLKKTPWKNYRCPDFNYYDLLKKIIKKIPGTIILRQKLIKWLKNY